MGLPLFKTPKEDKQDENASPQQQRASGFADYMNGLEFDRQLRRSAAAPEQTVRTATARQEHRFHPEAEIQARAHAFHLRNENRLRDITRDPENQRPAAAMGPFVMGAEQTSSDTPGSELLNQEPGGGIQDIYIPMELREQAIMLGERVAAVIRQELGRQHEQQGEQSAAAMVTNGEANIHDSGAEPATSHPTNSISTSNSNENLLAGNANLWSVWDLDHSAYVLPFTSMTQVEPLVESLSIALAPEPFPEPHHIDPAATPPIRSAAPSPQLATGHFRSRHSPDLHEHHPNCPCIDCWTLSRL
ncbi:hypothetical protein BKA61DRAFT_739156 [Leptodontidium sp. MPI-SDFR-AT-0119]|nr:hypothetical protein BKA61DRAFT_739156 [Leptodontidium sp. MPI-SDFR-AT-0119]